MKIILLTGGARFIGSNLIEYLLAEYNDYYIVCLDKLTYAGNMINIDAAVKNDRFRFVKGDICNRELVEYIFKEFQISGVIHLAAESHVDNSILNPGIFITTNVYGTFTLVDVAYKHWMKEPFKYIDEYKDSRFHHISTDEVYGTLGDEGYFTEKTPYAPNSPYSASKAASDMVVRSYYHTYGLNTLITNCSNNYGPRQHNEKLIPTVIRKALGGENIPIYGDGKNIRDWLYVSDHCRGIDMVYHHGKAGETYNIGGKNERDNNAIAYKICDILDKLKPRKDGRSYREQVTYVKDRPGHDRRYAIDAAKIENELGWKAEENFNTGIEKTVKWYINLHIDS